MATNSKKWSPSAGDETGNSYPRRKVEGFFDKYLKGRKVLDIGCGKNTVCEDAVGWDIAKGDGDATELKGVPKESYGAIYASHVLEHLPDPIAALHRWWEVLEPNGYLIVAVPDEDLYEQGQWPSLFNSDHRTTWTLHKSSSWSPASKNILDMIRALDCHKVISARILDTGYDYTKVGTDQPSAERQVEVIVQKQMGSPRWRNSVPLRPRCMCGAEESMKILGIYADGRALVNCMSCGQRMTWSLVAELKKLGIIQDR